MRAEENLFHKCPDRSLQTDKSSSRINSKQIAAFTLHSENEAVGEFEEFLSLFLSSVDSRVLAGGALGWLRGTDPVLVSPGTLAAEP